MSSIILPNITNRDEISSCPEHPIAHYLWRCTMKPEAYGQIALLDHKALVIRLVCKESNPVITYHNHFDKVYKDSAIEVFFQFGALNDIYINFEYNAHGALLAMVGADRYNRTRLNEDMIDILNIVAEKNADEWSITFTLPLDVIRYYHPDFSFEHENTFLFNFYKISETPEIEHYGSMCFIPLEEPNFHVPQYFAKAVID